MLGILCLFLPSLWQPHGGGCCQNSHFTDEETEAQRGRAARSRPLSQGGAAAGLNRGRVPTPCPPSWSPQFAAGRRRREGLRGSCWPGLLSPAGEADLFLRVARRGHGLLLGRARTPQRYEGCWQFSLGASPGEPVLWGCVSGQVPWAVVLGAAAAQEARL